MNAVLTLLVLQCVLGAFDNVWHHELQADLRHQSSARLELRLHTARELIYAVIFLGVAWWQWQGALAWLLMALLALETTITLWDFVEEDRSRRLPPLERVLHTVIAIQFGVLLALFVPILLRWAALPSGLVPVDYGLWSLALTVFGIGVLAWGLMDLVAVIQYRIPQWKRLPMETLTNPNPQHLLITGATGFIGSALVRRLRARGDAVTVLSRNAAKARDQFGPEVEVVTTLGEIADNRRFDAVINLAGEPLAGGLWTAARKRRFVESRVQTTQAVAALIQRLHHAPSVLISASAIGWYGERGDEVLHEQSSTGSDFAATLCQQWEAATEGAKREGLRICHLRIGLVLAAHGGVLQRLALATRFGGGAVLGDGRQWQSWIHLQDLLRLIDHVLASSTLEGAVNATAPEPVTQRAFMQALATALHRPLWLRMPAALLRALLGELATLFLASQRVLPQQAVDSGFRFRWPYLDAALAHIYNDAPLPAEEAV